MNEIEAIYKVLGDKFNISKDKVKARGNFRYLVNIRRIASTVLLKNTNFTVERIGEILGRDHSNISHYKKTTDFLLSSERNFKKDYDDVEHKFNILIGNLSLEGKLNKLLKDKEEIEREILCISEEINKEKKLKQKLCV